MRLVSYRFAASFPSSQGDKGASSTPPCLSPIVNELTTSIQANIQGLEGLQSTRTMLVFFATAACDSNGLTVGDDAIPLTSLSLTTSSQDPSLAFLRTHDIRRPESRVRPISRLVLFIT